MLDHPGLLVVGANTAPVTTLATREATFERLRAGWVAALLEHLATHRVDAAYSALRLCCATHHRWPVGISLQKTSEG
jgi:hypothetical protein